MKKRLLLYAAILLASCSMFSCSEDEDNFSNWIITKREYKIWSTGSTLLRMWNDTIYHNTEEFVIDYCISFESLSNSKYKYKADYREYRPKVSK